MKKLILLCAVWLTSVLSFAQIVNYSEHIAPIIFNHCTTCHRPGEIAPFSLTNYSEVNAWASMIEYVTTIKYMPPWKPDPNYKHYQRENILTDLEIQSIIDWVAQGTPQGDPALEPALPVYPTGSQIGQPDLVLSFAESYNHIGNNLDEYRYFVIPSGLTQDKDLIGLEVRPGNNAIVHHTIIKADTTNASATADAADPLYGYPPNLNTNTQNLTDLPGYVPGSKPVLYGSSMAQKLYAGSDLQIQMHYGPSATDETDSTTFNLFFAPQPALRYVKNFTMVPFGNVLTNGPFAIPANQVKTFHGTITTPTAVSLLNVSPHMHKLGQSWEVYAIEPDGDTINIIKINDWDFNWQSAYSFISPVVLEAGTAIHAYATYDNTTNNPYNPNNPPQLVTWGENTSDEMYFFAISYVTYQTGDENIVFDTTSATGIKNSGFYSVENKLYPVSPNPAGETIKIGFTLAEKTKVVIKLVDEKGTEIKLLIDGRKQYLDGLHTLDLSTADLGSGLYSLLLYVNDQTYSQKFIVAH